MDRDGKSVDAATENALLKWKDQIIEAIERTIDSKINSLEKSIGKEFGLKLDHFEKEQARSFKHHEEHFTAIRETNKRIDDLETRQTSDEKTEKVIQNRKAIMWTALATIVAVLSFIGGAIL